MSIFDHFQNFDDTIYKVNPQLKEEIFSKIPANYNNLEQAIFIYNELCKTLTYSLDYYLNERVYVYKFTDPDNIEMVDGKQNRDVVCFTFDRIFLKMLYDKNIIEFHDFWMNAGYSRENHYIDPRHNIMSISIDGTAYDIDATMGVFKDSDLSQSKFSDYKISGWQASVGLKKNIEKLKNAIKKVQKDSVGLQDAVYDYVKAKAESDDFIHYSIDMRANLFMRFISDYGHRNDIQVLSYAYKLKKLLFLQPEYDGMYKNDTKVAIQFLRNTQPPCLSMVMFYNVDKEIKAYQMDLTKEEFVINRQNVEQVINDSNSGKLKYVAGSKTIEDMLEPVYYAAKTHKKVDTLWKNRFIKIWTRFVKKSFKMSQKNSRFIKIFKKFFLTKMLLNK